jgi:hypothetical protein
LFIARSREKSERRQDLEEYKEREKQLRQGK